VTRIPPAFRAEPLEDRLAPAGDLDPTFGNGGVSALPPELSEVLFTATAVATAPDDKILVAGTVNSPLVSGVDTNFDFGVVRLTADGQLDPTFGGTGFVRIPFDLAGSVPPSHGNDDEASGVAVQPDGRVVVVGSATTTPNGGPTVMAAARLTADGQLDTSFGTGGRVTVPFGAGDYAVAAAVAIQPDGAIVLAGSDMMGAPFTGTNPPTAFAAARLTPDGNLDPSFGTSGTVSVPFPVGTNNVARAGAVALEPDGSIVLAGSAATDSQLVDLKLVVNLFDYAAVHLTPAGRLDTTFGDSGRVRVGFGDPSASEIAQAVMALADGRVVLAGTAGAARLTADGKLDPTYGSSGMATVPPADASSSSFAAIQVDGRVAIAQVIPNVLDPSNPGGTRVVGLTADGAADPAFSGNVVPGLFLSSRGAVAAQPDGNLVLAGTSTLNGLSSPPGVVFRILGTGQPAALPIHPGSVLAGGTPDGTARVLFPTGSGYAVGDPVTFFPGFAGNVRTAVADVNGDGTPDLIGGAGPGGPPTVTVLDGKTGATLVSTPAFEASFTGGVFVAAGDLDGDGRAEIVVTPDQGGGPNVVIFSVNADGSIASTKSFFALRNPAFRGGARPAAGDVNGDGTPDVIVGAGFLGGPNVEIHDGKALMAGDYTTLIGSGFFAFDGPDAQTLRNGVFLAAGDVNGDGFADLVVGGGPGGGPRVLILDGKHLAAGDVAGAYASPVANFFFGDDANRGGVRVATTNADGDKKGDVVVGSGEGLPSQVRMYLGRDFTTTAEPTTFQDVDPFGQALPGGVFVG
jgi:uncharacterized delta-60 repeat protein